MLELGRPYFSGLTLPELALPDLRALVADVRESVSIAVLDGIDIVYVAHVPAKRIASVSVDVGSRDPAFATALGRALLSGQDDGWLDAHLKPGSIGRITARTIVDPAKLRRELARVRRQGWALVDQELEEGLRALAAPIRDPDGTVVAAVNVAVHTSRWSVEAIRKNILPRLLGAAGAIERRVHVDSARRAALGAGRPGRRRLPRGDAAEAIAGREPDFVQSLERGLAVIRAFDSASPSLTLSEVARATGLARAAARRFLLTLVDLGYLRIEGRQFRLSPRVLELGRPYLASLTLPELALPHVRELVAATRESASVGVLDGDDIVYVAHVPGAANRVDLDHRRRAGSRVRNVSRACSPRRPGRRVARPLPRRDRAARDHRAHDHRCGKAPP